METSLLVRESIRGVIEQRGRTESIYPYPLSRELGFSRTSLISRAIISPPAWY